MLDADGLLTKPARLARMSFNSSCLPGQPLLKFRTGNSGGRSEWRKSSMKVVARSVISRDESLTWTVAFPVVRFSRVVDAAGGATV